MRKGLYAATVIAATLALAPASAGAATITTSTNIDELNAGAACSLREAIQSAVNNADFGGCDTNSEVVGAYGTATVGDTVVLAGAGPFNLTNMVVEENNNAQGDIDIGGGGPITIEGNGQSISQGFAERVFELQGITDDVTIRNVSIGGGDATGLVEKTGGNIRSASGNALTLDHVTVIGGAAEQGGGIYLTTSGASLQLVDSHLISNDATLHGGGIFTDQSDVFVNRSTVDFNHAGTGAANGNGGVDGGGIASIGGQAAITVLDSTISDNDAINPGNQVADRAEGGGIHAGDELFVRRSLIANNTTSAANNTAVERGGGIHLNSIDPSLIANSTVFGNVAGDGLSDTLTEGGGIYSDDLSINHVTFSGNNAKQLTEPGGGGDHIHGGGSGTTLRASILTSALTLNPCEGVGISTLGFNVYGSSDPDCGFGTPGPGDQQSGANGLVPGGPTDNGGPTDTIGLAAGSVPVDHVPAAECGPAEGTDQRGFPRSSPTFGAACDSGAYELSTCDGVLLNGPGAFPGCPEPAGTAPAPAATPPATFTPRRKKCKKRKRHRSAEVAKKKRCKKKRRR